VKLTLPYPISSNRYWASAVPKGWTRAVTYVTKEAKAYKAQCAWIAKAAGVKPLRGAVEVRLRLVPANRRRIDLSNCWKVAEDALNGIAFSDDSLVYRLRADLLAPDGNARLEVEVLPLDVPAPFFMT
jgi:crossover junction endodeoxyribonuclease RusA